MVVTLCDTGAVGCFFRTACLLRVRYCLEPVHLRLSISAPFSRMLTSQLALACFRLYFFGPVVMIPEHK